MAGQSHRVWSAVVAVMVTVGGLVASGSPAGAVGTSTTGQLIKISPPTSVLQSGLCSPDKVFTFDEQQGVTLGAAVQTDYKAPGSYTAYGPPNGVIVPAGSEIDSHFLHSNQYGCPGTTNREGTWKFSQDILGVIVSRFRLTKSDYLGAPETAYPGSVPSREFDMAGGTQPDFVQIVDARTVYVKLYTGGGPTGSDQMRVITKHNAAPVASAGGPYAGYEGTAVSLTGTASDPDGDPLTKSWTFSSPSPGTVCTTTGTTTLTPTISCNDDAMVTATLSVTDGFHAAVTSVANVTIANKAPTIGSFTVPTGPVANGAAVNVSATFGDVGTHDTHTASIAWGDTTTSTPPVNESGHIVAGSHIYAMPGTYSISITLNDDDGGTVSAGPQDVTVVGPPTAGTGGPYGGNEGSVTTLSGSASGSLPLTTNWVFTPGPSDAGTLCSYTGTTTLMPTVQCNDDLVVGAQLTVSDGVNPPVVSSSSVAVDNVVPVLAPVTATAGPIIAGQPVTVSSTFTDAGTNDSHTSTVDWGDMTTSSALVTEASGSGSISATHAYLVPGLYTVSVDVNDGDGGIATRTKVIRINTPPTADAGGPYTGPEGSVLTLGGSAADVDSDALTTTWTFAVAGAPPSVCSFGATTTLAPTVLCTDNAMVTATLTVSDGANPPVVSVATVSVGNVAPTLGAISTTASPVGLTTPVNVSVPFGDVGTSDTHTASIDWGDSTTSVGSVTESGGSGTASGVHTYTAPGSYLISVTVTDDDLDSSTTSATTVVIDGPPTVDAGGSYTIAEGSPLTLAGTASDPEGDPLTVFWSFAVAGNPGTVCLSSNTSTLTPTITCNDDALVVATLSVADPFNPPVTSDATITVYNVSPTLGPVVASPSTISLGGTVTVTVAFSDPGSNDTHVASINWGPGQGAGVMSVTESGGSGSATASHTYTAKGTFTLHVLVNDDDLDPSTGVGTVRVT